MLRLSLPKAISDPDEVKKILRHLVKTGKPPPARVLEHNPRAVSSEPEDRPMSVHTSLKA